MASSNWAAAFTKKPEVIVGDRTIYANNAAANVGFVNNLVITCVGLRGSMG